MTDVNPAQRMWTIGDYPTIAEHLWPISAETVDALGISVGDVVLDVGVGNGNAAIAAARRGATVTGVDLTPAQIERARARCEREGVDVDLRVGDAQDLDFEDGTFPFVTSVMGVIFAPDHHLALTEMARVRAPGGVIAVTSWAAGGWSGRWREAAARILPAPPDAPSPEAWGDAAEMRRRFESAGLEVEVTERPFEFRFPSEDAAFETFTTKVGPFVVFLEAVDALGRGDEARDAMRGVIREMNRARDGCAVHAPYLLAISR